MSSISIKLNNEKQITKISFNNNEELSLKELLDVAMSFLGLSCVSIVKQRANTPGYTEEQSKKDRAYLYDSLVLFISGLAETIYPEYQDLKEDPEKFLEHLDAKINELKELENASIQ